MLHIDIQEIENGYVIELFDSTGSSELDKTIYAKTWEEVLTHIEDWKKELRKS